MLDREISAVLIVKEEAERLPLCLPSLAGVDEVVVLDTGSSDRTMEVARDFGAVVHAVDPPIVPFHFAEARNRATALARNEWILSIDADERLAKGAIDEMKGAVAGAARSKVTGFRLWFRFVAGESEYARFVLFNRRHWSWRNRVHNVLVSDSVDRSSLRDLRSAVLEHFVPAHERRPWREEQTLELLRVETEENPGNARAWWHLGLEMHIRGDHADGARCLRKFLERTKDADEDRYKAMLYIAICLEADGKPDQAVGWLIKASDLDPRRREAPWFAFRNLAPRGRTEEALRWLRKCAEIPASSRPDLWAKGAEAWSDLPERSILWYKERGLL